MTQYFYHIKPNQMVGDNLLPLSKLEEQEPKLANLYLKSYKNREKLLNKRIEKLDCRWKDVIFFSCLNPIFIYSALESLGLDKELTSIIKFPISVLKNKEWCLYQEIKGKEQFNDCTVSKYKENKVLPPETAQYFVNCVNKKEDPLIFSNIQHILLKGELDINDGEEFDYKSFKMKITADRQFMNSYLLLASQYFFNRAMKLPLESRPMTGLQQTNHEVPVSVQDIDLTDKTPSIKNNPRTGFLPESFDGALMGIVNFMQANRELLGEMRKAVYNKTLLNLSKELMVMKPIISKLELSADDLDRLGFLDRNIFRVFDMMMGSDFGPAPGFETLMNSLYAVGPILHRFLSNRMENPDKNLWSKFDPDNVDQM